MPKRTLPKTSRKDQPSSRFNMVANQAMAGCSSNYPEAEKVLAFRERYKEVFMWVDNNTPKRTSLGVVGAIAKAVLWYGVEKIKPFCDALKNLQFTGLDDPAHVLYIWLMNQARYNTKDAYRRTVTAMRYFLDGRKIGVVYNGRLIVHKLYPATTDLFTWDETYTIMRRKGYQTCAGIIPTEERFAKTSIHDHRQNCIPATAN